MVDVDASAVTLVAAVIDDAFVIGIRSRYREGRFVIAAVDRKAVAVDQRVAEQQFLSVDTFLTLVVFEGLAILEIDAVGIGGVSL